jgi:glycosyltransferase involved in cell wall biosynthesis
MEQLQDTTFTSCEHAHRSGEKRDSTVQVSVIIPAFNAADTIVRAIDSVRGQNMPSLEIIVIDDGSVDRTVEIITANIRDGENIRLIRMEKNSGVSAARNAGIRVAQGNFLAFLDADDIWLPEKMRKQIETMKKDSSITLVSCNSRLISESGLPLKEGHINRPPAEGPNAWKTLLMYNFLPTPTVLTYTALVKELGGFDESLAVGEDLDLWIKLGLRGKIAVLKEILTNYYDRAGSLMKRHGGQTGDIVVPMLKKHIAEQRHRLTSSEIRHIRGYQSFQMGCNLFFSGIYLASMPIFLKAALYGRRPIKSLTYIPRAIFMELIMKVKLAISRSKS